MAVRKSQAARKRAQALHARLKKAIPKPHVELRFENPWQLLLAVILSAQSTDKMVNQVMPKLLERWSGPGALAAAAQEDVEPVIKSTGFFRNKAKSIRGASRMLVERFGGEVPKTMDELLTLPGVARKTANVVLGAAFGVTQGIAVDTHAMRMSQRLRFTKHTQPEKIEQDLCALFPKAQWTQAGHRLVLHGRYVCLARAPRCSECALNELCPSRQEEAEGSWTKRAEQERLEMESRAIPFKRV
ncbi:MAG: endonuclease III [Myxococcaceae bacterium]